MTLPHFPNTVEKPQLCDVYLRDEDANHHHQLPMNTVVGADIIQKGDDFYVFNYRIRRTEGIPGIQYTKAKVVRII